jgi:hypothetical protein
MESVNIVTMDKKKLFKQVGCVIIVLFAFVVALLILAPHTAVAEASGDYLYTTTGHPSVATVTGYTGAGGAITIPSTLGGHTVVAIGNNAFEQIDSLTSVTIPNSVTSIGDNAFHFCSSMTSVTIPNSVTSIGSGAFAYCMSLTSVTIPNSVTSIGGGAFSHSYYLTSVNIGSGVPSIGDYMFESCHSMTSVTIPNSVTSIGNFAFAECGSLTSVTIPNSVTSIGNNAFGLCSSLTSVTVGSGVISIGDYAFDQCGSLNSVSFSGSVAPNIVGSNWIESCPDGIRGHAYTASNFPGPGGIWNGLTMGPVIQEKPQAPTGLVATPGNAKIVVAWTAPSNTGVITAYKIYRGTVPGGETLLITVGNVLKYTDNGLAKGVTYYYKVSAVNSAGEGLKSNEASARTTASTTVPSAPTLISATPGNNKVMLVWTAPSYNGGSAIDYYVIYRNGVDVRHTSATSATITGLANGGTYSFAVAAHNSAGVGIRSSTQTITDCYNSHWWDNNNWGRQYGHLLWNFSPLGYCR